MGLELPRNCLTGEISCHLASVLLCGLHLNVNRAHLVKLTSLLGGSIPIVDWCLVFLPRFRTCPIDRLLGRAVSPVQASIYSRHLYSAQFV